jgi:hypothetical protein
MLVYAPQGTTVKCKQDPPALTAGQSYHVRVENPDHNNRMNYYLGSNRQGFFGVSFNQGVLRSFDERHNGSDSLHGVFDGLGFMGSADSWNDWPAVGSVDNVTGWRWCFIRADAYEVISGSC